MNSEEIDNCVTCDTEKGYVREDKSKLVATSKCVPKPGTYRPEEPKETEETLPCDYTCKTCTAGGASSCKTCIEGRKLSGSKCLCVPSTYDNKESDKTSKCDACHYSCYTCDGPDESSCLSC